MYWSAAIVGIRDGHVGTAWWGAEIAVPNPSYTPLEPGNVLWYGAGMVIAENVSFRMLEK